MQISSCVRVDAGDFCGSSYYDIIAIFVNAIKVEAVYKGCCNGHEFLGHSAVLLNISHIDGL